MAVLFDSSAVGADANCDPRRGRLPSQARFGVTAEEKCW
jgi:hypothetical protein